VEAQFVLTPGGKNGDDGVHPRTGRVLKWFRAAR
jgi:hypothetical protein